MARLIALFAFMGLLMSGLAVPASIAVAASPAAKAMAGCVGSSGEKRKCCPVADMNADCHACCAAVAMGRAILTGYHRAAAVGVASVTFEIVGRREAPPLPPPRRA